MFSNISECKLKTNQNECPAVIDSLDSDSSSFELAGSSHSLNIDFSDVAVPDGFEEGHTIAVKGNLINTADGWLLKAREIQTGCPSKYAE